MIKVGQWLEEMVTEKGRFVEEEDLDGGKSCEVKEREVEKEVGEVEEVGGRGRG